MRLVVMGFIVFFIRRVAHEVEKAIDQHRKAEEADRKENQSSSKA